MQLLEQTILKYGKVYAGDVLKVDSFLNHQVDVALLNKMGAELAGRFAGEGITKVLTLEASGIAVAIMAALSLGVKMVFAKKAKTSNSSSDVYTGRVHSYTRGKDFEIVVSKEYLGKDDNVLIVDDFLATGSALYGMIGIINQAGARLKGVGIAIEKGYQGGGDKLRGEGVRVESLAIIDKMSEDGIVFRG